MHAMGMLLSTVLYFYDFKCKTYHVYLQKVNTRGFIHVQVTKNYQQSMSLYTPVGVLFARSTIKKVS